MLTLNSVIKSSSETFFLFLVSNNFVEIKITVFKKTDTTVLFDYCCRDTNERIQQYIYYTFILLNNHIDRAVINSLCLLVFGEFIVDWMKHFFLTKMYHINPRVYLSYRYILCKCFLDFKQKREAREGDYELEEEKEDIAKDLHTKLEDEHGELLYDYNALFIKE